MNYEFDPFEIDERQEYGGDPEDPDYEPGICSNCSGSGEGQYDGTTCRVCKGKGEV